MFGFEKSVLESVTTIISDGDDCIYEPIDSAIVSGICTLKGPLHGAARKYVYKMLEETKKFQNIIKRKIGKSLGFGNIRLKSRPKNKLKV